MLSDYELKASVSRAEHLATQLLPTPSQPAYFVSKLRARNEMAKRVADLLVDVLLEAGVQRIYSDS